MRFFLLPTLMVLLLCPSLSVQAQEAQDLPDLEKATGGQKNIQSVVRVFGQVVSHRLPTDWKPGFQSEGQNHFIMEFVPKDESVKEWTNMFTLQAFHAPPAELTPEKLLVLTAMTQKQLCGDELVAESVEETPVSELPTKAAIIGCASVPKDLSIGLKKGMGEIAYYIAVQGKEDIYLFHKSIRSKGFARSESPITKDNVKAFMADFMPITLSDP